MEVYKLGEEAEFNEKLYALMMLMTDGCCMTQRQAPQDQQDWIGIITEVRQQWARQGCQYRYVCFSHSMYGRAWFERHIARRIQTHLRDWGDFGVTRNGQLFRVISIALRHSLQNEEANASADEGDSQRSSDTASQPAYDLPGEDQDQDEMMYDTETLNGSAARQRRHDTPGEGEAEMMHETDTVKEPADRPPAVEDKDEMMEDTDRFNESAETQPAADVHQYTNM